MLANLVYRTIWNQEGRARISRIGNRPQQKDNKTVHIIMLLLLIIVSNKVQDQIITDLEIIMSVREETKVEVGKLSKSNKEALSQYIDRANLIFQKVKLTQVY